jgi:hypothetical protein
VGHSTHGITDNYTLELLKADAEFRRKAAEETASVSTYLWNRNCQLPQCTQLKSLQLLENMVGPGRDSSFRPRHSVRLPRLSHSAGRPWCATEHEPRPTFYESASIPRANRTPFAQEEFPASYRCDALCAAANFLRETAESLRLLRIGTILSALPAFALTFAQRAFWAAAIRARAAAESLRRPVPFTYALANAARAAPIP